MKAVFDTNILFLGVGWRGAPHRCIQSIRRGPCQLILCREILDELQEKLVTKRSMPPENAAEIVEEIRALVRMVEIEGVVHQIEFDPDDDMVLECAITGGADCIVSGDHHLLDLGSWRGIAIVTAGEFLGKEETHG